jgi:hypothetical protein
VIRLRGICRDYPVGNQVVRALDHVDLDVAPGGYISIMFCSWANRSSLAPFNKWKWLSMNPGMTVLPIASITRVFGPRNDSASELPPTKIMRFP